MTLLSEPGSSVTGPLWTEETRELVLPRRRHGARDDLPNDGAAAELLRDICTLRREAIARGVSHAAPAEAIVQREVLAYFDAGAALSPRAAAASAVLLSHEHDPHGGHGARGGLTGEVASAAMVDDWLETRGPAFAIEACAATTTLAARGDPGSALVLHAQAFATLRHGPGEGVERHWNALRRRVATMPDDAFTVAHTAAASLRAAASLGLAHRLAYAFPDEEDWSADVARAVLAADHRTLFLSVLCSLSDRALTEQLVARAGDDAYELAAASFDIVDALGLEAAPALLLIAESAYASAYAMHGPYAWHGQVEAQAAVGALALLPTPAAAAWFASHLGDKSVRPFAHSLFTRAPRLGVRTLASLAGTLRPKAASDHASAMLAAIVRASPGAACSVIAELDEPAAKIVSGILQKSSVTTVAEASELPAVLADPPWASKAVKRKKKRAPTLPLELLPFAETIVWTDLPAASLPTCTAPSDDQVRVHEETWGRGGRVSLFVLAELSGAAALDLFRRLPVEAWSSWSLGEQLAELLARFGANAIEPCLRFASKQPAEVAVGLQALVSPRLAPLMAHVLARVTGARRVAEQWLVRNAEAAAIGLVVDLVGQTSDTRVRANAASALRFLSSRGKGAVIDAVAHAYGPPCVAALDAALAAYSVADSAPAKPPKMPTWFEPAALPRPRVAGTNAALPLEAVQHFGEMLAFTHHEEPHVYVGLEQVREACDADSLGEFAWALFEAWTLAGSPMDHKWAFFALGHFGRDEHAHRLAPLLRAWPSEGAFPRAVVGLEVLATMKSDVALMLIHGISEKVKSRPLLVKAREKIASVSESLGLSSEQLADRLVPTLGLSPDGSRVLDFGARRFHVGFDEHLRPFVNAIDDGGLGARVAELPKAGKHDDPELAASAQAEWKALKKAAKAAATQQIARLESGMIAGRRWEPGAFATYLAGHPLTGHLVRRLVFGVYDAAGVLTGTFRVAEDGSYASAEDEAFAVPAGACVGVVHPLELEAVVLAMWGERLSEYQILQPFSQLSRDVPRDLTIADATRFAAEVDSLKLLGLERRGWRRGAVGDGGVVSELEKEAGGLSAALVIEPGLYAGDPKMHPTQSPRELSFRDGVRPHAPSAVFLSEVVADLRAVGALSAG